MTWPDLEMGQLRSVSRLPGLLDGTPKSLAGVTSSTKTKTKLYDLVQRLQTAKLSASGRISVSTTLYQLAELGVGGISSPVKTSKRRSRALSTQLFPFEKTMRWQPLCRVERGLEAFCGLTCGFYIDLVD